MTIPRALRRREGSNNQGGVLVEGVVCIALVLLTLGLNLGIVRSAQYSVTLRHACFLYARWRALGNRENDALRRVRNLLRKTLPIKEADRIGRLLVFEAPANGELVAKVAFRYMRLFLPYRDPILPRDRLNPRNRPQLTEQCRFSFRQS
jgi:hypothetical protein